MRFVLAVTCPYHSHAHSVTCPWTLIYNCLSPMFIPVTTRPHPSTIVIPPPHQSTDSYAGSPTLPARQATSCHPPYPGAMQIGRLSRCADVGQRPWQSRPRNGARSTGVLGSRADSCLSLFSIHFTLLIHFHYLYDAAGDLVEQNPPLHLRPTSEFREAFVPQPGQRDEV
jgi:hypothetical protein